MPQSNRRTHIHTHTHTHTHTRTHTHTHTHTTCARARSYIYTHVRAHAHTHTHTFAHTHTRSHTHTHTHDRTHARAHTEPMTSVSHGGVLRAILSACPACCLAAPHFNKPRGKAAHCPRTAGRQSGECQRSGKSIERKSVGKSTGGKEDLVSPSSGRQSAATPSLTSATQQTEILKGFKISAAEISGVGYRAADGRNARAD